MVFNSTFNNISVISWRSVTCILVQETGVPGENHRHAASHWAGSFLLFGVHRLHPAYFFYLFVSGTVYARCTLSYTVLNWARIRSKMAKSLYLFFYSVTSGNPSLGMASSVRLQQIIVSAIALSLLSIILKFIWRIIYRIYWLNFFTQIINLENHRSSNISSIKLSIFLCLVDIF